MSVTDDILAIEARLKAARIPLGEFCRSVPVDASTWWRWREGNQMPNLAAWRRVEAAASDLPQVDAA